MTRRIAAMVGIGTVVLGIAVAGQVRAPQATAPPAFMDPVSGLTLDDAIAQALEHEPSLRATQSDVDVATGRQLQARLHPNPSVSFSQQQEPTGTDSQTRVDVQWPLDLFRKAGRVAVADREIESAKLARADRARTLIADVRMKYGEVVAAVRDLSIADELIASTTRQQALVSARVDDGTAAPLDRDRLRVELRRFEAERILQEGEAERSLAELKRLLGVLPEAPVRLRESLEELVQRDTSSPFSVDAQRALSARPDVLHAQSRVDVATAEVGRARRDGRFDVSLFGTYTRMDAGFPQRGLTPFGDLERVHGVFHYVAGGAMVTIPFQNKNQGTISAAEAERAGATARADAARLAANSEIAAARMRDEHARRALADYATEVPALARQNLDVVRQTYELGRGTFLDVLTEQQRYLDFERTYTDLLREAYEARQTLKLALGDVR